jgi:hypothetical protein
MIEKLKHYPATGTNSPAIGGITNKINELVDEVNNSRDSVFKEIHLMYDSGEPCVVKSLYSSSDGRLHVTVEEPYQPEPPSTDPPE